LQYKIPKFINSLYAAGDQPNEICILLAASRMQILQKQAASTLLSCPSTKKALLNHPNFGPSQTGETAPLN
jgi:hypothetical protein